MQVSNDGELYITVSFQAVVITGITSNQPATLVV